jgi:sulfide:quinone oxidoreductase
MRVSFTGEGMAMEIKKIDERFSVSAQLSIDDLDALSADKVEILVCNRPDHEAADQPTFAEIEAAAKERGMEAVQLAFKPAELRHDQVVEFGQLLNSGKKIHGYCRTGNRSTNIWAASQVNLGHSLAAVASEAAVTGFDVTGFLQQAESSGVVQRPDYDVVIVGAGSAGIAVAASLKKREPRLRIVLIDPSNEHYYQPGWTLVGAGVFNQKSTQRKMRSLIPSGVSWLQQTVVAFDPENNRVSLENGEKVRYQQLVVCPGLKLDWSAVEGLDAALGKNGVTSNYRYDLAPYTWELVNSLKRGKAVFTQPSMPIKCAGAPQKALYLSADAWRREGVLKDISIDFYNAGAVLFGVQHYVPALMKYIEKYRARLHFKQTLVRVDGPQQKAWFASVDDAGVKHETCVEFDMLHVCPPQCAPDFVRNSSLADANGWLDVDQATLRHQRFTNIWGLGDVTNAPNAKTMAAARKQVPVVADNLVSAMKSQVLTGRYDGYGSCPLTVERGKIVLAEFGYGGKLLPTFPAWLNNGAQPTRFAWFLKARALPAVYWHLMLKGREWLV